MPAKLTALSHLGLAVETTEGTVVPATAWAPVLTQKPQDLPKFIPDEGLRGQPVMTYGEYLGPKSATYDMTGDFFPLSGGNLLAAMWGVDTVTGTASPYTHTFSLAATPPSYTLSDYYVAGARQWPGSRLTGLTIKFTPDAGVTYTAKWLAWPSATYTVETTTYETTPFLLGWEAALTLAGSSDPVLESLTLDLTRAKSQSLFAANNTQNPYNTFVGPMQAKWTLGFYMQGDTEYAYALSQATQTVSVAITEPSSGPVLTLSSHAVQFTKPTIDRGKEYVLVDISGEAVYNSTDAGVATAVLQNSISTAYSTTAAS